MDADQSLLWSWALQKRVSQAVETGGKEEKEKWTMGEEHIAGLYMAAASGRPAGAGDVPALGLLGR